MSLAPILGYGCFIVVLFTRVGGFTMKFNKESEGHYTLDVKGYVCPHPQIYTKKALSKLNSGEHLSVVFDNPSSGESIESMIDITGHEIVEKRKDNGQFVWDIQKA
jgi:tRNA 2-thiouridine synthesizing protein A